MDPKVFEKSGALYLGRTWDAQTTTPTDAPLLYKSGHLTTHAVCVGMTGSGKTGLGICVLEELAMDGVPAIVIDPKGDMGNLLLTFPELSGEDFLPWVSSEEASRKEMSKAELAAQTAATWKAGLASWGQDGARIARLRETIDFALYTPGSTAGRPLALLKSLHAPSAELREDPDLYRDRVGDTVSGLLELAGIKADPVTSREHILLSTILRTAWDQGEDMSLETLVGRVPEPGIRRIGAFDLDMFFPAKDRFALAMQLNNLLASPSFAAWAEGDALDIDTLLWTPDGKPKISILNIAHLSDAERMVLVASIIGELLSWMRRQRGTDELRALFYMDEIFGYLPPTAEPPSKRGLMTLLKQARAFGLGLMLCTQNPADIDYKALSNTGTWFVGRLQTPQDRDRLLKGMASSMDAGGHAMDRATLSDLISNLGKRRFVMQNVHQGYPVLFESRWAMSYMAGPLSRPQILELVAGQSPASLPPSKAEGGVRAQTPMPTQNTTESASPQAVQASTQQALPEGFVREKPVLAPKIQEAYMPVGVAPKPNDLLLWRPMVLGCATGVIDRKRPPVQATLMLSRISFVEDRPVPLQWTQADDCPFDENALVTARPTQGVWQLPAPALSDAQWFSRWEKDLLDYWVNHAGVDTYAAPTLKLQSEENETLDAFRARVKHEAKQAYELALQKTQAKFEKRLVTVQERMERYASVADDKRRDARSRQVSSVASGIGALLGGKKTAMRTVVNQQRMAGRAASAAQRAENQYAAAKEQRDLIDQEYQQERQQLEAQWQHAAQDVQVEKVGPPKSGLRMRYFGLVWVPYYDDGSGPWRRAWVLPSPCAVE